MPRFVSDPCVSACVVCVMFVVACGALRLSDGMFVAVSPIGVEGGWCGEVWGGVGRGQRGRVWVVDMLKDAEGGLGTIR